jgi:hypothetical protein
MDAIRKKMQSLKAETEQLYATIRRYEDATKEYTARADQVNMTCFFILNIVEEPSGSGQSMYIGPRVVVQLRKS